MRIRARTKTALRNGVGFILLGAVVGTIISVADLDNFSLIACLKYTAKGALIGAIVVAPIVIFEALFMQSPAGKRLQGLSFRAVTAVRSIIYVIFIYVGFGVERFVSQRPGDTTLISADHQIYEFAVACLFVIFLGVLIQLSRLLGPTILRKLVSGRYHRPREEQRVFLLLDIKSSAEIAETIGNARFHELLDQVFFDLTDPILENGGEIYRYNHRFMVAQRGSAKRSCGALLLCSNRKAGKTESGLSTPFRYRARSPRSAPLRASDLWRNGRCSPRDRLPRRYAEHHCLYRKGMWRNRLSGTGFRRIC